MWLSEHQDESVGGVTAAEGNGCVVFSVGLGTGGGCSEGKIYRKTGFQENACGTADNSSRNSLLR